MFDAAQTLEFLKYIQQVTERPRRMDQQWHRRESNFLWCDDWEILEILKYYVNGPQGYAGDPPPNRLKNNPMFDKEQIAKQAEQLIAEFSNPEGVIQYFKERRTRAA